MEFDSTDAKWQTGGIPRPGPGVESGGGCCDEAWRSGGLPGVRRQGAGWEGKKGKEELTVEDVKGLV